MKYIYVQLKLSRAEIIQRLEADLDKINVLLNQVVDNSKYVLYYPSEFMMVDTSRGLGAVKFHDDYMQPQINTKSQAQYLAGRVETQLGNHPSYASLGVFYMQLSIYLQDQIDNLKTKIK